MSRMTRLSVEPFALKNPALRVIKVIAFPPPTAWVDYSRTLYGCKHEKHMCQACGIFACGFVCPPSSEKYSAGKFMRSERRVS